jgi:hypothetical protein
MRTVTVRRAAAGALLVAAAVPAVASSPAVAALPLAPTSADQGRVTLSVSDRASSVGGTAAPASWPFAGPPAPTPTPSRVVPGEQTAGSDSGLPALAAELAVVLLVVAGGAWLVLGHRGV